MTVQQLPVQSAFFNPPANTTITTNANTMLLQIGQFWPGGVDYWNISYEMDFSDPSRTLITYNNTAAIYACTHTLTDFSSFPANVQNMISGTIYKYQVTGKSRWIDIYAWGGGGGSGSASGNSDPVWAPYGDGYGSLVANGGAGGFAYTRLEIGTHILPGAYLYIYPGSAGAGGSASWYGSVGGGATVVWTSNTNLTLGVNLNNSQKTALNGSLTTSSCILVAGGGGGAGVCRWYSSQVNLKAGDGGSGGADGSYPLVNAGTQPYTGVFGLAGTSTAHGGAGTLTNILNKRGVPLGGGYTNSTTQRGELAWANLLPYNACSFADGADANVSTYCTTTSSGGGVYQGAPGAWWAVGGTANPVAGDANGDGVQNTWDSITAGGGGGGSKVYRGSNQVVQNSGASPIPYNSSLTGGFAYGGQGRGYSNTAGTVQKVWTGRGGTPGICILVFGGE